MRLPKRGERGFTLIELLIVVAILGVLAAVVIPNVSRFIGRGEEEAINTEFANIQAAVSAMMVDNSISTLLMPVLAGGDATNSMADFPDITTNTAKGKDILGTPYDGNDGRGFVLYQHDRIAGDGGTGNLTNYVAQPTTAYFYTVDATGTIEQWDAAAGGRNKLNP